VKNTAEVWWLAMNGRNGEPPVLVFFFNIDFVCSVETVSFLAFASSVKQMGCFRVWPFPLPLRFDRYHSSSTIHSKRWSESAADREFVRIILSCCSFNPHGHWRIPMKVDSDKRDNCWQETNYINKSTCTFDKIYAKNLFC